MIITDKILYHNLYSEQKDLGIKFTDGVHSYFVRIPEYGALYHQDDMSMIHDYLDQLTDYELAEMRINNKEAA